jgi:uncharacterized protein YndB with AHSA1/START domain
MATTKTVTVTTPSEKEIKIERAFAAPRTRVFDALTRPALVKQWLLGPPGWTMPVCEIDLRPGGKFRYVWRHRGKDDMGVSGTYREVVRPERIVHTEVFDEDWTGGPTTVTTQLGERDGRTTLTITVLYATRESRDGALRSGMESGMESSYATLDQLLETA